MSDELIVCELLVRLEELMEIPLLFGCEMDIWNGVLKPEVSKLVIVAGQANSMEPASFRQLAEDKLSSGDIPIHAIRKLSDRIDEYVGKLLSATEASAEIKVSAMGAFRPVEPDYAEPLVELLHRLAANADATSKLPRQLDAILFERLVRRRDLSPTIRRRLAINGNCERLVRLIAAFLRGQFDLPSTVDKVLTTSLSPSENTTDAHHPHQESLFPGNQ